MHKNDKQNNYSSDPSWKSLLADTSYNALNNFVTCLNRVLNHFTPNSDKHLRSPNSITPESNIAGHEKKGNDCELNKLYTVRQILLVISIGNV